MARGVTLPSADEFLAHVGITCADEQTLQGKAYRQLKVHEAKRSGSPNDVLAAGFAQLVYMAIAANHGEELNFPKPA